MNLISDNNNLNFIIRRTAPPCAPNTAKLIWIAPDHLVGNVRFHHGRFVMVQPFGQQLYQVGLLRS